MKDKIKPFIFTKCTSKNIFINNILWGVLVLLDFSLLVLVTKNVESAAGVAGIKTLPGFLVIGPLLWILSIGWVMTIKIFNEFRYNMLSLTLMAILAIPLYLVFGIISFIITIIVLFLRFKITEARTEEEMKREERRNNKISKQGNKKKKSK